MFKLPRFRLKTIVSLLLDKSHIRCWPAAFGRFLYRPELRLITGDILGEGAPNALRVSGTDNHAAQQLSLRAIREDVNEIQRELLQSVVQNHQIAILAL